MVNLNMMRIRELLEITCDTVRKQYPNTVVSYEINGVGCAINIRTKGSVKIKYHRNYPFDLDYVAFVFKDEKGAVEEGLRIGKNFAKNLCYDMYKGVIE